MENNNCSKCDETTVEGRAFVDPETKMIYVDLKATDIPEQLDILVPYVCTTCGATTWKVKSKMEDEK